MDLFTRNILLVMMAIVIVSLVTMYSINPTGAFFKSQPRDGYCRCITGTYTAGVGGSYYGSRGMEFKGFTTYNACVDICKGRHSWMAR